MSQPMQSPVFVGRREAWPSGSAWRRSRRKPPQRARVQHPGQARGGQPGRGGRGGAPPRR